MRPPVTTTMLSSKHAVTVCIALAAAVAVVTAATSARVVLEPLAHHPHGWSRGPRAAADGLHNVAIGLRRAVDDAVLVDELEAVSTPGSPRYGQHLSRAEVEALSTPALGCEAVVRAWLEPLDGAAVDVAGHGDWLRVSGAPLGALEALIEAEFYEWSHPLRATHAPLVRASAYTVPATVAACVRIVDNVKMLPTIRERTVRTVPAGAPQEIYGVTPQLLREVWNVPSGLVGNSTNGQIMAAAEFNAGDNYAPDDLAAFLKKWKLPSDLAVARVIGGNNPKQPSIECDMDVQVGSDLTACTVLPAGLLCLHACGGRGVCLSVCLWRVCVCCVCVRAEPCMCSEDAERRASLSSLKTKGCLVVFACAHRIDSHNSHFPVPWVQEMIGMNQVGPECACVCLVGGAAMWGVGQRCRDGVR